MVRTEPTPLTRLRLGHDAQVVGLLRARGPLSRADLGRLTGLSRTALSDITAGLVARGVVVVAEPADTGPRGRGRPVELLQLDPGTGQLAGVDLGRHRARVVVVNAAHEIIASRSRPYPPDIAVDTRIAAALDLLTDFAADGIRLDALEGIGIGVVGIVGPDEKARVRDAFHDRHPVTILVDNNTRLAALGEATRGAGAHVDEMVYVRLSHGVAGGLVLGGRLVRGVTGAAGEFGHVNVVPDGPPCQCGGRGCLETQASLPAVITAAGLEYPGSGNVDELLAVLAQPEAPLHAQAVAAVAHAGRCLGQVLAGVCGAVNPKLLVVGGDLARTGRHLLDPVDAELRRLTLGIAYEAAELCLEQLGDDAGAWGAIALLLQESPVLAGYADAPPTSTRRF